MLKFGFLDFLLFHILDVNKMEKILRKENYSSDFAEMLKTIYEPCQFKSPSEPPKWLDKELYKEGLSFINNYYFAVTIALVPNLVIGLSIPNLW